MIRQITCAIAAALALFLTLSSHAPPARAASADAIDTTLMDRTMETLARGSEQQKDAAVAAIRAAPGKYAPPVLYVLSSVLFSDGEKDEAAFWFYAGQLRAQYDANRCAQESAQVAVAVLNSQFGSVINKHAFQDRSKLEALIPRVVEWDRRTPHDYEHRWINLRAPENRPGTGNGEAAGVNGRMSRPRDEWPAIAARTRADYLAAFDQVMKEVREREQRKQRRPRDAT